MRLLRSSRFRRRAGWLAVCLAVAGVVAFVGIHFSNTGHAEKQVFEPGKPQLVPEAPKADTFTPAEQRQVRAVAVRFSSAVYRSTSPIRSPHDQRAASGLSPTDWRPARSRSSPTGNAVTRSAGASTTPTRTRSVSRSPSTRRPGRVSIGRSSTSRSRTTARPERPTGSSATGLPRAACSSHEATRARPRSARIRRSRRSERSGCSCRSA